MQILRAIGGLDLYSARTFLAGLPLGLPMDAHTFFATMLLMVFWVGVLLLSTLLLTILFGAPATAKLFFVVISNISVISAINGECSSCLVSICNFMSLVFGDWTSQNGHWNLVPELLSIFPSFSLFLVFFVVAKNHWGFPVSFLL